METFVTRLNVLNYDASVGDYEVGRLANTGKNFWTAEPTLALMYLGQKNGREASLFIGASFNEENPDTHYKSGTQFHVDGTLASHEVVAEFKWLHETDTEKRLQGGHPLAQGRLQVLLICVGEYLVSCPA